MTITRRLLLQVAALVPFSRARAARNSSGVYAQLGIRPVINFSGTQTIYGASKIREELHDAMAEASREYVVLAELQEKVGERLARLTNCESAMVTTGAAGAICLGTCASLTGEDSAKVRRLPDLAGMKSEVIIQKSTATATITPFGPPASASMRSKHWTSFGMPVDHRPP